MPQRQVPEGPDPFDLARFVQAQEHAYARALAELRSGRKRSHWMWYIFPQMRGLGTSPLSRQYGISSRAEASAYLRHPVLGPRLVECASAVLATGGASATDILGSPDDRKLRSSATLFAQVADRPSVFGEILETFYGGVPDAATLRLLGPA